MEISIESRSQRFEVCVLLRDLLQEYANNYTDSAKLEELYPKIIENLTELEQIEASIPIQGLVAVNDNVTFFNLWHLYVQSIQKSPHMSFSSEAVPQLIKRFMAMHERLSNN